MSISNKVKGSLYLSFFLGLSFFNSVYAISSSFHIYLHNNTNITLEITNSNYYQHNMGTSVKFSLDNIKPLEQIKDLGSIYILPGHYVYGTGTADTSAWGAFSVDFDVLGKATGKIVATYGIAQPESMDAFKLKNSTIVASYNVINQKKTETKSLFNNLFILSSYISM